ncbi:MAG: copper-binding protein [Gammaproteobacteria bacterium]|jgi:Cu/Ag efflux protein CusF
MKPTLSGLVLSALLLAGASALAQSHAHDHAPANQTPGSPAASDALPWTDAEVRRVDPAARKITLRHGPIANLDMPPMSMAFQVDDAALIGPLQPGDQVRFIAEQRQGGYWATRIEKKTP